MSGLECSWWVVLMQISFNNLPPNVRNEKLWDYWVGRDARATQRFVDISSPIAGKVWRFGWILDYDNETRFGWWCHFRISYNGKHYYTNCQVRTIPRWNIEVHNCLPDQSGICLKLDTCFSCSETLLPRRGFLLGRAKKIDVSASGRPSGVRPDSVTLDLPEISKFVGK